MIRYVVSDENKEPIGILDADVCKSQAPVVNQATLMQIPLECKILTEAIVIGSYHFSDSIIQSMIHSNSASFSHPAPNFPSRAT